MHARDHDLAQPVAADEPASNVPASPPRRDPVEDADPSFTRKRPRLGSGSNSIRALSVDTESPAHTAASPREQQVEMTIRSHPPSSPVHGDTEHGNDADERLEDPQHLSPVLVAATEDDLSSPPVMAIVDDEDEIAPPFTVQPDAEDLFYRFPFPSLGDYTQVVQELPKYISGSQPIDSSILPALSDWLSEVPEPSVDVQGFYLSKVVFWDEFGTVVNKVLSRRYQWMTALSEDSSNDPARFPFGDQFDDIQTDQIFYRFLSAYVRVCSFLFLVDVHILSRPRPDEIYPLPLISHKHIRYLHNIIRSERAPVFHVLQKEYGTDAQDMTNRLRKDFLNARGASSLFQLMDKIFHRVSPDIQNIFAQFAAPLFSNLGWTVFEHPNASTSIDRSEFYASALNFFETYSEDLQDATKPIDAGVARDLIQYYSILVHELCQWDDRIAAKLVDKILDFGDPESPTTPTLVADTAGISVNKYLQNPMCFPALINNAWKFKILRKYIVKGNMGLRVMSIATMDAALVELWREYSNIDPTCKHPVMQYLADFLLKGQVVDYIVSVDSHPQLISRSGNIVGFLVVTHRWSNRQADAIWRTVATSPDPRVVVATMTMLRGIISLMRHSDRHYLCSKLHDLPIERYTLDILRFLRDLTMRPGEPQLRFDETEPSSRPWNVCVRMIRDTAPSRDADANLLDLHSEAIDQFHVWINRITVPERHEIYRESAQQIASHAATATGNFKIICMLMLLSYQADTSFFQQHQSLIRSVLEEIPQFITAEASRSSYSCRVQALLYRLDFLRVAISHSGVDVPTDLYQKLWDYTIGKSALSNEARDLAWSQLHHATRAVPNNDFCTQLVTSYIPTMDAKHYTVGMYEFIASYTFSPARVAVNTGSGSQTVLQVPGASLLWPIILSAPQGTIEDRAANLLASRYVGIVDNIGIILSEVEDAHRALVEKCMEELRIAVKALPQQRREKHATSVNDDVEDTSAQQSAEARIGRILMFLRILLDFVRRKAQFSRGKRADSKVEAMEVDEPTGDAVIVRYQCGNDRQVVTMASENTLDDLYRRLCHVSGYTKVNLFAKGQRLDLTQDGPRKLSEFDLGGQVIVQRADGAESTRPLPSPVSGSSVLESAIVSHFDEFFSWMDSDDVTSASLFAFLSVFPDRSSFADKVTQGGVSTTELFPPGKVFQSRYAAFALKNRLSYQLRTSTMDETFARNAVQHLDEALVSSGLDEESLTSPQELQLAAVLVSVLLEFLKERPSSETSASYFSDGSSLVNRLMQVVSIAIATPSLAVTAIEAHATILEASLHSRAVWAAFKEHQDSHRVHQHLLLTHSSQAVREQACQNIFWICSGDLPFTCPLTRGETASHFWAILSAILPNAVQDAGQSQQLFQLAEQVFRINDEYDRNEQHLRAFLAQWSALLLQHDYKVFPGRDDIDHVVFGFTKLILECILSIKSFKKPVNAGSLMTQVFKKFIFVSNALDTQGSDEEGSLPILESHTRRELYELMLGLAEDSNTYDVLLQLAGDVDQDEGESILPLNLVDRTMEIRSGTGYVGLYNPRAICYMNSLLTQLFMNINFRHFILSLDVKDAAGSQRLLFETQRLFAQMQNLYCKSTDPREFAACVKSLDKTPIDISVQMDADEFYNLLFDQWESQLFKQEHKQQFRSFYGGQTLNQIKSKECEHVSERAEPFFAVQCDVQGKANLHESLQAYVQGDVMEGDNKYKCESCDGKFVDAVKRTCLKSVPDNLIFHLKRFEFDLNDFSRRKIYDHFAFPDTLDITPYTIDHLADPSKPAENDLFDLVGVLVHTGTCENGHYYSYIRERPGSSDDTSPTWIEFNDSDVGPFDPSEIAERTYGGLTEGDGYSKHTKQFSAYMLFYQRRTAVEQDQRRWMATSKTPVPKLSVPDSIGEEIATRNRSFVREYCLFDPVHTKFVRQLHNISRIVNHGTCSESHEQETRALHVILAHLCYTAWRQFNAEIFLDAIPQLRVSMTSCSVCCSIALQWLAADDYALTNILLRCTHPKIRHQVRAILIESLKHLRAKEPVLYGVEGSDSEMDVDSSSSHESVVVALGQRLRITANDTRESVRGWDDFYLLLTQFAELGNLETAVLLNNGFLHFCLKIFCMHAYAPFRSDAPELSRIIEKRRGIFNRLVAFLWKLLSTTDIRLPTITDSRSNDRLATFDRERMKFPLLRREKTAATYWSEEIKAIAILDKILEVFDETKVDHFYPGGIFTWLLESPDDVVQNNVLKTIVEGLQLEPPYCDAYVHAALPFCESCPKSENISKVINAISKAISSSNRIAEDRTPSGEAVLGFFSKLLTAQNETFFEQRHPHAFHQCLMLRSKTYAIPLLCHYDEHVRKATYTFFERLYENEEAIAGEMMTTKYKSVRDLLVELMHKFGYEKEIGRHRSFLTPLVDTCRLLVTLLYALGQRQEAEYEPFQDINDTALIYQYQQEVETRMRMWPHDEGTPLSQDEPFEQSDYGSESDEPQELLDN
ncbi:hypothetical protein BKA63DRAFT_165338 [Paraphoma chrysanthemicola]|nr:hypothetical protein BKA63DRAFT_165338 [Paraphoma chrysanthemicola]